MLILDAPKNLLGGFKPNQLYKSALGKFNDRGLTNAGVGLSKHPRVVGLTKQNFNKTLRTVANQNAAAHSALKNILRNNKGNIIPNRRWGQVLEVRGANGKGARWQTDGTFIGFVD